jgi:hypothetical protein
MSGMKGGKGKAKTERNQLLEPRERSLTAARLLHRALGRESRVVELELLTQLGDRLRDTKTVGEFERWADWLNCILFAPNNVEEGWAQYLKLRNENPQRAIWLLKQAAEEIEKEKQRLGLPVDREFLERVAELDENNPPHYDGDPPPSETAEPSAASGMWDDLNTNLKTAVKLARTEALARLVDLNNPALTQGERLRRARRLVRSFQRRRAENPDFPASPEVLTAFSIINKDNYQRRKAAKAGHKAKLAM